MDETLGVPAHRGGLVVEHPELSVGIVRAVARPVGLELELVARRPLDRRSASERQADIRARRGTLPAAPRRLLPAFDEGVDLRVGWLDRGGRAHWEFASSWSSSSGDHYEGAHGPSLQAVLHLPPLFDQASLVLAWPEIGFPETVVELALPDRATVERGTVSIWDAPLHARPAPGPLHQRIGGFPFEELAVEAGRLVAGPQLLSRGVDAAVVLTRLTAIGAALSMEIVSVAKGDRAQDAGAADPGQLRMHGSGASVAVVQDRDAIWVPSQGGSSSGGGRTFRSTMEFVVRRPGGGVLDLLVAWPAAGLPDMCVTIPVPEQ
ncbi:hypothetical protein OHA72_34690 [Dactylosporangium sp. NBC_01737]|uniref:hypothetical protein n=1 Tax=Dactylosporangium sp. NBC_01737 TaxID=2975959 RepID=UPI002E1434AE|nr:hypothetical protein OHA72_34690 [Dactylosporangium sp. NBC_01737]